MSHSRLIKYIIATAILTAVVPPAHAGPELSKSVVAISTERSLFDRGMREFDTTMGWMCSPISSTWHRPKYNYAQLNFRYGWMLNSPSGSGFFRGNYEFMANLMGSEVTWGPGTWMAGGRVLLRYNFVQPNARLVPFFTLGGGGLADDAYQERPQRVIGSGFEFTLVVSGGLRYFVNKDCAMVLSANFEHISNAGTAERNLGNNAFGGEFGISKFF